MTTGSGYIKRDVEIVATREEEASTDSFWQRWFAAFWRVFPIYLVIHLVLFVATSLSAMLTLHDFDESTLPLSTLWQSWNRLDVGHYLYLATQGYTDSWRTAFFPLYPLLIRAVMILIHNPLVAAMLISNVAELIMLMVLYQLMKEDFDAEHADRAVLYLVIFPTAFFFSAAYTESPFLCLTLISFYQMRRGHWLLAGLFGLLASLMRSAGVFLLVPFAYEYLRQHDFQVIKLRLDGLAAALIPAGLGAFALYCYWRFGDVLAFSHAGAHWDRHLQWPWYGISSSISIILHHHFLSFYSLRNLTDLIPALFILVLLILSFVGPWRLPRSHWSYSFYAIILYLFIQLVPADASTTMPLASQARYMMEIFPAFTVLAAMGRHRIVHQSYLLISGSVFFFLLSQFVSQRWMI